MPRKISRVAAKKRGLRRYFTGEPCRRGHVAERHCSGGNCIECVHVNNASPKTRRAQKRYSKSVKGRRVLRRWMKANRKKLRGYKLKYSRSPKGRATPRRWRIANAGKMRRYHRRWRAANPKKVRQYLRRYHQSTKGRASLRRWRKANPEKLRASKRRYDQSPKGRASQWRADHSPNGVERHRRFRDSPKARVNRERYEQTPRGIEKRWRRQQRYLQNRRGHYPPSTAASRQRNADQWRARHLKRVQAEYNAMPTVHNYSRLMRCRG